MPSVDALVEEFRRRRQAGRTVVRADDVHQAVEIAARLKAAGDAHWFRGQVCDWPLLAPTYHRLSESETEDANVRLARFQRWVKETPGLEELAADDDKLIAVAQHYGLATTFLDFTTEPRVAGFFAADGDPPPDGPLSCIICLNLDEAREIWPSMRSVHPEVPEALELDVSNLWRLEAQHGTFVWCPYDTLDGPYPLDRIAFAHTGAYDIRREEIYPARESALEALLNHYFQEEAVRDGSRLLREQIEPYLDVNRVAMEARSFLPEVFTTDPAPDDSWAPGTVSRWLAIEREYWRDAATGAERPLSVDTQEEPATVRETVERVVGALLASSPELRQDLPRWTVSTRSGDRALDDVLTRALQRVWDGMARLPYDDDELSVAMGATAALVIANAAGEPRDDAARRVMREPVAVELGGSGINVHAFAWIDDAALRNAVRDDFESLLRPEKRAGVLGSTFNILMSARDPRLLFDFDRLKALFALEIVPSQVALDPGNPTIFSPARLDVLGPK